MYKNRYNTPLCRLSLDGDDVKHIGIKYQLRLTTLIPAAIIALLFALFYNLQYFVDLNRYTSNLGEAYIKQLIPAAQWALLRNDQRTLQGLVDASIINPDIQALAFYDTNKRLLVYRGHKRLLSKILPHSQYANEYTVHHPVNATTINFVAPITLPRFNIYAPSTQGSADTRSDDVLGWLSIDIDTQSMLIKRYKMVMMTLLITSLGLLIALITHFFFSKPIYLPIARLRRSMKQILLNEFETEIKHTSLGELGIIEQGCVHLQTTYLNAIKELNQHIEVATADLQQSLEMLEEKNIELSLDKKKIEDKNKQKSEFIANMSHEIRTPMNGVIGFTNLLMESRLDSLQLDYVKTIKSSAHDLLAIMNDILDYSKMEAGKLNLDCIPLDIRGCIDEVLTLISPNANKKGIDLIPITAINVPKTVLGDPLRLKQIISNLVSNAVKFTDHGYVLIRTTIEQELDKEYLIRLSITDTGIGISHQDQTTLFTAYNQADTTITRRYGGSGLGLVISNKLAEQMHGRISLKSELHKGSTFTILIKLEKLEAYEIEKHQTHRFVNLQVICFDDNPLHLEALCNGLGNWGIHCIQVSTFNQLEEAFNKHTHVDLAFINVNQGCENQVAHILRKQSTPCVLLSKWSIDNHHELGAKPFLFKPPNMQKLHETVDLLMNQAHITRTMHHELDVLREKLGKIQPTILIAEDNPVNCMLFESLLSKIAVIDTVNDGEKALAICKQKRFHVILLDLQMPLLNGLDAASLIRKEALLNATTPIILVSANHNDVTSSQLQKASIKLCLQKPIDEATLLKHLIEITRQDNSAAIDWLMCVQRVSGNQTLASDYLACFVQELKKNREELIRYYQQDNLKMLEADAHKLYGACCFCGVPSLQRQVAQFESLIKQSRRKQDISDAFKLLIQSIDAVLREYEQFYLSEKVAL